MPAAPSVPVAIHALLRGRACIYCFLKALTGCCGVAAAVPRSLAMLTLKLRLLGKPGSVGIVLITLFVVLYRSSNSCNMHISKIGFGVLSLLQYRWGGFGTVKP